MSTKFTSNFLKFIKQSWRFYLAKQVIYHKYSRTLHKCRELLGNGLSKKSDGKIKYIHGPAINKNKKNVTFSQYVNRPKINSRKFAKKRIHMIGITIFSILRHWNWPPLDSKIATCNLFKLCVKISVATTYQLSRKIYQNVPCISDFFLLTGISYNHSPSPQLSK